MFDLSSKLRAYNNKYHFLEKGHQIYFESYNIMRVNWNMRPLTRHHHSNMLKISSQKAKSENKNPFFQKYIVFTMSYIWSYSQSFAHPSPSCCIGNSHNLKENHTNKEVSFKCVAKWFRFKVKYFQLIHMKINEILVLF